jgi:hypothetical protein
MDDFSRYVFKKNDVVCAANFGRLDIIKQFPPEEISGHLYTEALKVAIKFGHSNVVEYLLQLDNSISRGDYNGIYIALKNAIEYGHTDTLRVAFTDKLDCVITDLRYLDGILISLVENGHKDILKRYLNDSRLKSIYIQAQFIVSKLKISLLSGLLERAKTLDMFILIASSEHISSDFETVVLCACYYGRLDILRYLITVLNVDLTEVSKMAIDVAAREGHCEVFEYLEQNGCDGSQVKITNTNIEMTRYLLGKEWIHPADNNYKCFETQLKAYMGYQCIIGDYNPERIDILKIILMDARTNPVQLHECVGKILGCKSNNETKENFHRVILIWDLIFRFIDPRLFVSSFTNKSDEFCKYMWETYPSVREFKTIFILKCYDPEFIMYLLLSEHTPLTGSEIKQLLDKHVKYNLAVIKFLWQTYPAHRREMGHTILTRSTDEIAAEIPLRDPNFVVTENTFFNVMLNKNVNLVYSILQDVRYHNYELSLSEFNDHDEEMEKLLLKCRVNIPFRDQNRYINSWQRVLQEEQDIVLFGRALMESCKLNEDAALSIMKYDPRIYRYSSMICVPKSDIFQRYEDLFRNNI